MFPIAFLAVMLLALAPAQAQLQNPGATGYANEGADFGVPPQDTLHTGTPHAPTPLSVPGARTITTVQLYGLLTARQPMLLIYVNHPSGEGIEGSHWLYSGGTGTSLGDIVQARFMEKMSQLTAGNKDAAIVTYCQDAHCWLSYNAALRLAKSDYHNVYWYRGGREAWKSAGLSLVPLAPDPW
jgi:PQQ-dependent catabolism-associated CXXCW motif protein